MKCNKQIFLAIFVFASLLISGCGSSPNIFTFDPDIPVDRTASVLFGYSIQVIQYNGIDVQNEWYPDDRRSDA